MTDKSGIEMLEEILSRLAIIEKRLDVMDNNIKAIANSTKMASLINKAAGTPLDGWAKATKPGISANAKHKIEEIQEKAGFKNFAFQPADAAQVKGAAALANKTARAAPPPPKLRNVMVKGRLKIEKEGTTVPLASASVKIFDATDKLIKETRTNRAGHWMSQLAPGRYVALFEGEINGKKLLPQNKNFEVPQDLPTGQTEFEVV